MPAARQAVDTGDGAMLKRLLGKAPVEVWVIKQLGPDLLHLCGQGTLETRRKRKDVLEALADGTFQGAVAMTGSGVVLNARLFAALVPVEQLQLLPDGHARWQQRDWRVAQVPQRCWTYEGRLIAQATPHGDATGLVSSEDVSSIRRRIDQEPPRHDGVVDFRPAEALEDDPRIAPRNHARDNDTRRLPGQGREWRRDDDH